MNESSPPAEEYPSQRTAETISEPFSVRTLPNFLAELIKGLSFSNKYASFD